MFLNVLISMNVGNVLEAGNVNYNILILRRLLEKGRKRRILGNDIMMRMILTRKIRMMKMMEMIMTTMRKRRRWRVRLRVRGLLMMVKGLKINLISCIFNCRLMYESNLGKLTSFLFLPLLFYFLLNVELG